MSNATLVSATLAGTTAAVAESVLMYPLEYVKTRRQMAMRPLSASLPDYAIPQLKSVFFHGLSPFAAGNALKTVLRFSVFNSATKFMTAGTGQATAPAVVVSGMMTGILETLVLVPFESVKVTMIEASSVGRGASVGALLPLGAAGTQLVRKPDLQKVPSGAGTLPHGVHTETGSHSQVRAQESKPGVQEGQFGVAESRTAAAETKSARAKPVRPVRPAAPIPPVSDGLQPITGPKGIFRTVRDMYRARGLRAFVQGFNPTVTRQVTNSALRFTSWNLWSQLVSIDGEERMSIWAVLFGSGATAAVEGVATQPIDVIKTRMQTANGRALYGNSLVCAYRVFTEEGRGQLWAGLAPRIVRKWVGGGIIWATYELSSKSIDRAMREHPFQ